MRKGNNNVFLLSSMLKETMLVGELDTILLNQFNMVAIGGTGKDSMFYCTRHRTYKHKFNERQNIVIQFELLKSSNITSLNVIKVIEVSDNDNIVKLL